MPRISSCLALIFLSFSIACSQQNSIVESSSPASMAPSIQAEEIGWQPGPGTSWQIQLSGPIDSSYEVQVYDIDLFDAEASLIERLHAQGRKVICYFSAGSFEDWRSDSGIFPKDVIGKDYENWPGERWLDIRQIDKLAPIMRARMDLAVEKRCDAVDPDNVEGFENDTGFPLSAEDQLVFNRWLASEAHQRKLAIGLKNDLGQIADLVSVFDFSVNESCFENQECEELSSFIQANKPVFGIEYQGDTDEYCTLANQKNFDTLKKNLDLDAVRQSCR